MSSPSERIPGVLIVSEDPAVIQQACEAMRPLDTRVSGCLGPTHSSCPLEDHRVCQLVKHASVVLVDSPTSGAFTHHWKTMGSGDYAERLQRAHYDHLIILSGAPEGSSGSTGEVVTVTTTRSALKLLQALLAVRSSRPHELG